jgi:hypothetical protein
VSYDIEALDLDQAHLDILRPQVSPSNHVKYPSRCPTNDLLTGFQFPNILTHTSSPDASMTRNVHVIAQSKHNSLDLDCQFSSWG